MLNMREYSGVKLEVQEWKFSRSISKYRDVIFVFVEGPSDKLFFSNFLNGCEIFVRGGWEKLLETMHEAEKIDLRGFLGIIDSDFRRICPEKYSTLPTNIFWTDGHDTEIMLLHSPALKKVLNEYSYQDKGEGSLSPTRLAKFESATGKPILTTLLEAAKPLSILKLVIFEKEHLNAKKEPLSIRFKEQKKGGFDYPDNPKFIDSEHLTCNWESLLKAVENFNSKINWFKNEWKPVKEDAEIRLKLDFDLPELCNGHDVVHILALALEKAIGNESPTKRAKLSQDLEKELRLAYQPAYFAQTQLYEQLKAWPVPPGFHLEILP